MSDGELERKMHLRFLEHRDRQPELMDDPALDGQTHVNALKGLSSLNRASMIARTVDREIVRRFGAEPLTILDVAAGSGDLVVNLAQRAAKRSSPWKFSACDISETACQQIQANADTAGVAIETLCLDAVHDPLPGSHDLVMCHLFLHHLAEHDIVAMLRSMARTARKAVLITDLARSPLGYMLAFVASRALTRSPIVHEDALLSVRGALSEAELSRLAAEAGLSNMKLNRIWPERFLLWWEA